MRLRNGSFPMILTFILLLVMSCESKKVSYFSMENHRLEDSLIIQLIPKLKKINAEKQEAFYTLMENQNLQVPLDSEYLELQAVCESISVKELKQILEQWKTKLQLEFVLYDNNLNRSILNDYWEEQISFDYSFKLNEAGKTTRKSVTLHVLSHRDEILQLTIRNSNNYEPGTFDPYPLYRRTQLAEVERFFKAYYNTYHTHISLNDLFETEIEYGSECGLAPIDPKYRVIMKKALEQKDTLFLNFCLSLPSLERQVYAYEMLLRLENDGYQLSEKQRFLMSLLEQRKGTVYFCSSCSYYYRDWQDILQMLKLNE